MKFLFILATLFGLILFEGPLWAMDPNSQPIYFQSDALDYREAEQIIIASGNVTVQQSSYTFRSDYSVFNIPQKTLEAWGMVRFKDSQGNEIRSKHLTYRSEKGTARLIDAEGLFGPWLFATKRVERDSEGNFFLERAKLSTCETDLSKYHLYGHKIRIMPKKRLTVQHALFRIGPIPVLYLPYYYYSLGERHLAFQIFPGQNQSEGPFVRTVWGYPPTDQIYLKAYLDVLTRRGLGTGGEINYDFSDQAKGSVYGFQIDDRLTHRRRWNARLFHWQELNEHWLLQTNANRLSDDSFPNDFFREDFNRVVRDPKSSISATLQKKSSIVRVFGERTEAFKSTEQDFFTEEAFAPKAEWTMLQTPLGFWGLEKTASVSFTNRFAGKSSSGETLSRSYRRESEASFSILKRFRIFNPTALAPKATVKNDWIDRPQGMEFDERFKQKLRFETTLRQTLGAAASFDLTHQIDQRLEANTGEDQGRETHALNFFAWVHPTDLLSFRFDSGHRLPIKRGEALALLDRSRYLPLKGELTLSPQPQIEIFFREEYTLYDTITENAHPISTQSEFLWGQRSLGKDYFMMGTSYSASKDHQFEFRQSARYSLSRALKIEGTLRSNLFYEPPHLFKIHQADVFEKEALVRSQWRCWDFSFIFRERKGVLEFLFNVELVLERAEREKRPQSAQGSEWYPWRTFQ